MQATEQDRMFEPQEAAEEIGISTSQLGTLRRAGKIAGMPSGPGTTSAFLYAESEVRRLAALYAGRRRMMSQRQAG